jgi:hypothetical protein
LVAGVFEHLPLLLKNRVLPSGLLVGVVNQYDLQRPSGVPLVS